MNILLFGAAGIVGNAVLRECLYADDVERVQTVGRTATGQHHALLVEIVHQDRWNCDAIEAQLSGFDACFFCLGLSSTGMSEEQYKRMPYDLTLAAAETLSRLNRPMTFVYVSGAGIDSTERSRSMWARVKGRTESALRIPPLKAVCLFQPGLIEPMHGGQLKTASCRRIYSALKPYRRCCSLFPRSELTTETIGRAMLVVARTGARQVVLEATDISSHCRAAARAV
ncbi:MAG TPA: hypothetical protein VII70_02760 [Steroidobacteraceae bacterium]